MCQTKPIVIQIFLSRLKMTKMSDKGRETPPISSVVTTHSMERFSTLLTFLSHTLATLQPRFLQIYLPFAGTHPIQNIWKNTRPQRCGGDWRLLQVQSRAPTRTVTAVERTFIASTRMGEKCGLSLAKRTIMQARLLKTSTKFAISIANACHQVRMSSLTSKWKLFSSSLA